MPKYDPAQDLENLTDMNEIEVKGMTASEFSDAIEQLNEGYIGPIAYCSECHSKGQKSTADRLDTFIHDKTSMDSIYGETRNSIHHPEQYRSFIYGGYGSSFDFNLIMLTPEQDKAIADSLCDKCLVKALKALGTPIDLYAYGMFARLTYRQLSVSEIEQFCL